MNTVRVFVCKSPDISQHQHVLLYHQTYLYSENFFGWFGWIHFFGLKSFPKQLEPHSFFQPWGTNCQRINLRSRRFAGCWDQLWTHRLCQLLQVTTSSQPSVEGINAYYEAQEDQEASSGYDRKRERHLGTFYTGYMKLPFLHDLLTC